MLFGKYFVLHCIFIKKFIENNPEGGGLCHTPLAPLHITGPIGSPWIGPLIEKSCGCLVAVIVAEVAHHMHDFFAQFDNKRFIRFLSFKGTRLILQTPFFLKHVLLFVLFLKLVYC
jgi:hypothetical protein